MHASVHRQVRIGACGVSQGTAMLQIEAACAQSLSDSLSFKCPHIRIKRCNILALKFL